MSLHSFPDISEISDNATAEVNKSKAIKIIPNIDRTNIVQSPIINKIPAPEWISEGNETPFSSEKIFSKAIPIIIIPSSEYGPYGSCYIEKNPKDIPPEESILCFCNII